MTSLVFVLTVVVVSAAVYMGWKLFEVLVLAVCTFIALYAVAWLMRSMFGGLSKVSESVIGDAARLMNQFENLQQELNKAISRARRTEEIDRIWARLNGLRQQLTTIDRRFGALSVKIAESIERLQVKYERDKADLEQYEALVAKAQEQGVEPTKIVPVYTPILHNAAARRVQSDESILPASMELLASVNKMHDAVREAADWIEINWPIWEEKTPILKELGLYDGAARRILAAMPPLKTVVSPFADIESDQIRDMKETTARFQNIVAELPSAGAKKEKVDLVREVAQEIAQALATA